MNFKTILIRAAGVIFLVMLGAFLALAFTNKKTSTTPQASIAAPPARPVPAGMLQLSEHARAMASVDTVQVSRRRVTRVIQAVGKVNYNETALASISARVDGYAERLFVDYTGVEVKAGAPLVEIYSPDLVVAQQEMLVALDSANSPSLVESTTRKLLRWGPTQRQVDELVRSRKVHERLTLFSPVAGTVIEKIVQQKAMVKPGEVLYRLVNLDSVWVYLDLYENELAALQAGQSVEITAEAVPGKVFRGKVRFINPVLSEESRTVKLVVAIDNAGKLLKPGMYVNASINADAPGDGKAEGLQLTVPLTAVLDSGTRKIVYVEKGSGQFLAVEVTTGERTDNAYPVLSGLTEGDRVVTRGNFLLDSQFQIRGLPSLFYKEGAAPAAGHKHGGPGAPSAAPPVATSPAAPASPPRALAPAPAPAQHQGH
ncbi:MAG: efflux RND transporter periplasmic adaptor subunit [Telluria sp.]